MSSKDILAYEVLVASPLVQAMPSWFPKANDFAFRGLVIEGDFVTRGAAARMVWSSASEGSELRGLRIYLIENIEDFEG